MHNLSLISALFPSPKILDRLFAANRQTLASRRPRQATTEHNITSFLAGPSGLRVGVIRSAAMGCATTATLFTIGTSVMHYRDYDSVTSPADGLASQEGAGIFPGWPAN